LQEVEVIAHRGAAATRPENTMASVIKAVEDGADWVEIDVQETADGAVLVVHDSDFMKAAGVATKVWDITLPEVAEIDIGSWFGPEYASERAPLLADVLEAVRDKSKLLIELKYYGHDVDLENRVIALVEDAGMADQIATMSLKYPAVQKMIELRPDWRTGVLAATAVGDLSGLEGDFLAVSAGRVSARLIAAAEASEKQVYAWTVNDPTTMSRMISMGVHGLITDRPAMARAVIAHYQTLDTPERLMLRLGNLVGFAFDVTPEEGGEM
jgi:glycerophosphoryl diester phosphodiesterase